MLTTHSTIKMPPLFRSANAFVQGMTAVLVIALVCGASVLAAPKPPVEITAIVLSKTCPLPDSPEMNLTSPESIIKSLDDPRCPKLGELQLIQAAVTNRGSRADQVGVEFDVHIGDQSSTAKNFRRVYSIAPQDTIRVLHDIVMDQPGLYRVSVRLWDSKFQRVLVQTQAGEERRFLIASQSLVEEAEAQMSGGGSPGSLRAVPLKFDPPDLRWESAQVIPKHALRDERLRIRLNLMNVGGDIVRGAMASVEYYNVRQPRRKTIIGTPSVNVMAPGEIVTFDLEYILPDDQLLGEYQIVAMIDPEGMVEELNENNNEIKSNVIRLSDIKLLLPTEGFVFEENGLFLFQWDSLVFSEFKIQVGVDDKFEDSGAYFDLPQGNRWIADKEMVPLSGELPGMAMGLMKSLEKNKLFWRVIGRQSSGRQSISEIRTFTINPVSGSKQS